MVCVDRGQHGRGEWATAQAMPSDITSMAGTRRTLTSSTRNAVC